MRYVYGGVQITFNWTIWKKANTVKEDFDQSELSVLLYGPADKYYIPVEITGKGDVAGQLPESLPAGVYSMRAFWTKKAFRANGRVLESEQNCFIAVTYNENEVESTSRNIRLLLQSGISTYGKDGLSAYEIAILLGQTTLRESEWSNVNVDLAEAEHQRQVNEDVRIENENTRIEQFAAREAEIARLEEEVRALMREVDIESINTKLDDMQNQIDGIDEHGVAVSQQYGDDPHIAISQQTLTGTINQIWETLKNITGNRDEGIIMTVIPEYFVGTEGCNVIISTTVTNYQDLEFFVDGVSVGRYTSEEPMEEPLTVHIDDTAVIKCVAQMLGRIYTQEKTISKVTSFFIGAGSAPADIMDEDHQHDISGGMAGYYDIEAEDGDYIMIVMDSSYESEFDRADMNGFEIPFNIDRESVSGNTVYKSVNAYQAGTYRIYINR